MLDLSKGNQEKTPVLSIVICFRDWGLDRLAAAIRSHFDCAKDIDIEVIVSDYGSEDFQGILDVVQPLGGKVARTDTSAPWSRSASLNAGIAVSRGKYIVTTDADIIFSPPSYTEVVKFLDSNPNALYLIQCRDLPEEYDARAIEDILRSKAKTNDWWLTLDRASIIRPRWGMGGFAAFARDKFVEINGYDERMMIWGGEDNDFAKRFRRSGYPIRWLSSNKTRIYHIWHESSQKKALEADEGKTAVENNREILQSDSSIVRNLSKTILSCDCAPIVSVVIPTFKRSDLLKDCLVSCQSQTFSGFEVIVVENGDSNEARDIVGSLKDSRFKYIKTCEKGASIARNIGLDAAKGRYIVIHDDDDIMISTRIEDHLKALTEGVSGTYSGWIDFEHDTYEVIACHPCKEFTFESLLCNGKVITHGSLMLDSRIFRMFRYENSLSAGIDYGFILKLARNGLKLNHTKRYGILRRMHSNNLTRCDAAAQKSSGRQMAEVFKSIYSNAEYKKIRQIGLNARSMVCENHEAATKELEKYSARCEIGVSKVSMGTSRFANLGELDRFIELEVKGTENLHSDLKGVSSGLRYLIYSRIRLRELRKKANI
ncbi:MAG: glycosyltransferase [gamma proteobacterium endosymbiont of Lamellibrachia anaximandri]|nr:glycosyltransferase [gamma proteobacterium endosymbiont of Lamellibrachia anaximandri]